MPPSQLFVGNELAVFDLCVASCYLHVRVRVLPTYLGRTHNQWRATTHNTCYSCNELNGTRVTTTSSLLLVATTHRPAIDAGAVTVTAWG